MATLVDEFLATLTFPQDSSECGSVVQCEVRSGVCVGRLLAIKWDSTKTSPAYASSAGTLLADTPCCQGSVSDLAAARRTVALPRKKKVSHSPEDPFC